MAALQFLVYADTIIYVRYFIKAEQFDITLLWLIVCGLKLIASSANGTVFRSYSAYRF